MTALGTQVFIPRPERQGIAARRAEFVAEFGERAGFGKPSGGLWTSTWATSHEVGWESWCREEMPHWLTPVGYLLTPEADANILTIRGEADVLAFVDAYTCPHPEIEGLIEVNWLAVAAAYDGVRVTNPYHPVIRFGPVTAFYGWDCESTWWTRWAFAEDEGTPSAILSFIGHPVLTPKEET